MFNSKRIFVFILLLSSLSITSYAQAEKTLPSKASSVLIDHLIQYVEKSDLIIVRNGDEYEGKAAAQHMRNKYEYFGSSIETPKSFIEKTATKSMLSGKLYMVRLRDGSEEPLHVWLEKELESEKAKLQQQEKIH